MPDTHAIRETRPAERATAHRDASNWPAMVGRWAKGAESRLLLTLSGDAFGRPSKQDWPSWSVW